MKINAGKPIRILYWGKHNGSPPKSLKLRVMIMMLIHSFHWHVQNAVIPCHSQELLPFFPIVYFFLPLFSANYALILLHFVLPSISWSTSWSCCFQIRTQYSFGDDDDGVYLTTACYSMEGREKVMKIWVELYRLTIWSSGGPLWSVMNLL